MVVSTRYTQGRDTLNTKQIFVDELYSVTDWLQIFRCYKLVACILEKNGGSLHNKHLHGDMSKVYVGISKYLNYV